MSETQSFPPEVIISSTYNSEALPQESLPLFIIKALEVFQRDHFQRRAQLPVQIEESGFGGDAYPRGGERLQFHDALPGSVQDDDETMREHWRRFGFTDDEISSGISTLISWSSERNDRSRVTVTGRVFMAGLLDARPGVRILRQGENGSCVESDLTRVETTAIVRLAFLSQLVGYISNRSPDESSYGTINAFVEEAVAGGGEHGIKIDGDPLKDMFNSPWLNNVTIIAGMKRFYNLVEEYRWRVSNFDNPLYAGMDIQELTKLVHSGEYFMRVITSLGFKVDELDRGSTSPLAIEPVK